MSIPAESSLFQDEVQVFNAEPCKQLSGPDTKLHVLIKHSTIFVVILSHRYQALFE